MEYRKFYRDGLEELVSGKISTVVTSEGHTVEIYKNKAGRTRYFVTLSGTHWCAHGDSLASAISDAIWKDPKQRPSLEKLKEEIQKAGKERKITLNEFRLLTGACLAGCRDALSRAGRDESPLTAKEIVEHVSKEWGEKLMCILGWKHD